MKSYEVLYIIKANTADDAKEAVIEKLRSFNREKSIKRAESREKIRPHSREAESRVLIWIYRFPLHPVEPALVCC